jgi:hypothetical protein
MQRVLFLQRLGAAFVPIALFGAACSPSPVAPPTLARPATTSLAVPAAAGPVATKPPTNPVDPLKIRFGGAVTPPSMVHIAPYVAKSMGFFDEVALKKLGVRLAIDDFGTGYSSLSSLKRFPVDTLKIDQTFVDGLGQDERDTAIVRSIIDLANALKLNITAEGIETAAQEAQLLALGCNQGQGYLLARPLPAADIELLFSAGASHKNAA